MRLSLMRLAALEKNANFLITSTQLIVNKIKLTETSLFSSPFRLPPGWSPAFRTAGCPTKEPDDEQVERTRTGKPHRLGRGI